MSNVFLISDNHFGHSNFLKFLDIDGNKIRPFFNVEEMDEYMVFQWNSVVRPSDKVYHLGDICFNLKTLNRVMPQLNGIKVLIKGNHDNLKLSQYQKYFKDVRGSHSIDKYVLSHIPLHPESIGRWALGNIHGHTHEKHVMINTENNISVLNNRKDSRYINVCVEQLNYTPISYEELKDKHVKRQYK